MHTPDDQYTARDDNAPSLLEAALTYAKRGIPVFPLWGTDGRGACHCPKQKCTNPGKHPRTEHGLSDATTEPLIIRSWWTRWPDANIGLLTGKQVVVLDPDDLQGALKEASEWGVELVGFHSQTGKGRHYLFRAPAGISLRNKAKATSSWPLRLCDARGEGGYIVAPPSLHPSGKRYEWSAPFDLSRVPEVPGGLLEIWRDPDDDPRNLDPLADLADDAPTEDDGVEAIGGDGFGDVTAMYWVRRYIHRVQRVGADRNPTGFLLALQLRDNGLSRHDAEPYARQYQQAVEKYRPTKEDYTWEEMVGSLNQAYSQPPRSPTRTGRKKGKKPDLSPVEQALLLLRPLFEESRLAADTLPPTAEGAASDAPHLAPGLASGLAPSPAELFHDASGEGYATVPVREHHETMRIRSGSLKRWIRWHFQERTGKTITTQTVNEIIEQWAAEAQFTGPLREVAFRIWQPTDDTIWLDLGDDDHQAVQITPAGWTVWADPPVKFLRKKGSLALPAPLKATSDEPPGARLERLLRKHLNIAPPQSREVASDAWGPRTVETDHDWVLFVAWLLTTLCGAGPYPILQLSGEKGAGKSLLGRVVRKLVDPHKVELEPQPGDLRDMAITAQGTWLLAYDNLTKLTDAMSNALARMSTGGGFRTRQLYSDDEEALFAFQRPVLLTGISEVVVKPDLLDRTLTLRLPFIKKPARKAERRFWREFDADHPAILGALLDVLVLTLRALPNVQPAELPRMADFAQWAGAVEVAMGWPEGTFQAAFSASEAAANLTALEGSPVAEALLRLLTDIRKGGNWVDAERKVAIAGTMAQLLAALKNQQRQMDDGDPNWLRDHPGWPRTPRGLSAQMAEIAANLRAERWALQKVGQRTYEIRWLGGDDANDADGGDDGDAGHDGGGWGLRR